MSRDIYSIASDVGFNLPRGVEYHDLAIYHRWGLKNNNYVVRTAKDTYVFGNSGSGSRYKVVDNELIEQRRGAIE